MADSYVSFSNPNNLDIFPSFKSFYKPQTEQDAFTIDDRDIADMEKSIPTNSIKESKLNNPTSDMTKKSNSNSSIQCDICLVPISSEIVYITHINGRKHQTILTALISKNPQYKPLTYEELCSKKPIINNQNESSELSSLNLSANNIKTIPPLIPSNQFTCTTCNVICNSQQMFENHVTGKKHRIKLKSANLTDIAPSRNIIPDNNPSSSNYCDVCSLQLKSENELTEHLGQRRHQVKVIDSEMCMKAAIEMKINFDDYKILNTTTDKNGFIYECTKCKKKMSDKRNLIHHLKSPLHIRLANRVNKETRPKRENYQTTSNGIMRGGLTMRRQQHSSLNKSNKPNKSLEQTRSYQSKRSSSNQSFHQQTSDNPFGAFDPYNQFTHSSNNSNNYYSSTKRPAQYEDVSNEYDGFYPKRTCTYNNETDNTKDFYSNNQYDYPETSDIYTSQITTNYFDQSGLSSQPSYQYQPDLYYDPQQYLNPESDYKSSIYYSSTQPPLPNYEPPPPLPTYPPPLPTYPPPSSELNYSQSSKYPTGTKTHTNNQYYSSSYQY